MRTGTRENAMPGAGGFPPITFASAILRALWPRVAPDGDGFTEAGNFSTYDMALGGTLAVPVGDDLSVGATVKLLRESLSDASSNGTAMDFGLLYQANEEHSWNLGAALQNLGIASKFADAACGFRLPSAPAFPASLFRNGC